LKALAVTLAVNEVLIQLVAWRTTLVGAKAPRSIPFNVNLKSGTWDDCLLELWPNVTGSLKWPAPLQFARDDFKPVAYRVGGAYPIDCVEVTAYCLLP